MCILSDINDPASNYFLGPCPSTWAVETFFLSQSSNTVRKTQWEKARWKKGWINLILYLVKIYNIKHRLSVRVTVNVGDLSFVTVIIIIR